jgi:hypothetical protein
VASVVQSLVAHDLWLLLPAVFRYLLEEGVEDVVAANLA